MPDFTVTVSGHLDGLIVCDAPTQHGPLSLREDDKGRVLFEVELAVDSEDEAHQAVEVMPAVVAAMCAIGWGIWVRAHPSDWSVERPDGTLRVGKAVRLLTRSHADLSKPPPMPGGLEAFWATMRGDPERVLELLNVLGLGLRASQSADYVSGLWAFATVIEEEAPKGKNNIDHARETADRLRAAGFNIPADPQRHPAEIRASALHPTPNSPLPTFNEVHWLLTIARAYLADRLQSPPAAPVG